MVGRLGQADFKEGWLIFLVTLYPITATIAVDQDHAGEVCHDHELLPPYTAHVACGNGCSNGCEVILAGNEGRLIALL